MTRDEAIKWLEDTFEGWERWNPHNDSPASKLSEALDMAISALREQEERSKGCEYCKEYKSIVEEQECFISLDETKSKGVFLEAFTWDINLEAKVQFCPMCGRRLEEVCPEE